MNNFSTPELRAKFYGASLDLAKWMVEAYECADSFDMSFSIDTMNGYSEFKYYGLEAPTHQVHMSILDGEPRFRVLVPAYQFLPPVITRKSLLDGMKEVAGRYSIAIEEVKAPVEATKRKKDAHST